MSRSGVLVIDKPQGPTSFWVVQHVRRKLRMKRVGHTGTLDPMATGVLPVCVGKATKIARFITAGHKVYEGVIRLGVETDTYDSAGKVVDTMPVPSSIDEERLRGLIQSYTGKVLQSPPPYSAVKHQGRPLYKLARKGIMVQKEPRPVEIFSFEILKVDLPDLHFRIHCTKGTYVRSLAHEIGKALGTGGHLARLCRLKSGPFTLEQAISIEEFDKLVEEKRLSEVLIPVHMALDHLPKVEITEELARDLRFGRSIPQGLIMDLLTQQGVTPARGIPYLRLVLKQDSPSRNGELVSVVPWPEEESGVEQSPLRPYKVWPRAVGIE